MRDALKRSMGEVGFRDIQNRFEKQVNGGEWIELAKIGPGRAFTTAEMIQYESNTISMMRAGQNQHAALASFEIRREIDQKHDHLSNSQRAAVEQILSNRDQVLGLEGVAGGGKTTSLAAIREAAEREGYRVDGLAPTSRAAHQLGEAGIATSTLQRHLKHEEPKQIEEKRLYILDESSLASTKQVHEFLQRLGSQDRVLMLGDTRQHEAVEAGRPYQQLQGSGNADCPIG